jgi:hypothetical protein
MEEGAPGGPNEQKNMKSINPFDIIYSKLLSIFFTTLDKKAEFPLIGQTIPGDIYMTSS